jgi:hypothetical protein
MLEKYPLTIKSVESSKEIGNIKIMVEARSSGSKPKMESEEILELDSEGDIVSGKEKAVVQAALRPGDKNYINTRTSDKSDVKGYNKNPPAPLTTLLGKDGLNCSDEELVKQSLIAWRHHLKSRSEYKPDRILPYETHQKHARILMSALSNFKEQRIKNQFTHRAKLLHKHDQYSIMYMAYHVPANTCTPYELMSKVDLDRQRYSVSVKMCAP